MTICLPCPTDLRGQGSDSASPPPSRHSLFSTQSTRLLRRVTIPFCIRSKSSGVSPIVATRSMLKVFSRKRRPAALCLCTKCAPETMCDQRGNMTVLRQSRQHLHEQSATECRRGARAAVHSLNPGDVLNAPWRLPRARADAEPADRPWPLPARSERRSPLLPRALRVPRC